MKKIKNLNKILKIISNKIKINHILLKLCNSLFTIEK
jgi:hypothetical protein